MKEETPQEELLHTPDQCTACYHGRECCCPKAFTKSEPTPQWEERLRKDNSWFGLPPEEINRDGIQNLKAFIKSTLEEERKAVAKEVIEDIKPNDRDSYTNHVLQDLINKLKEKWL